ncbi:MAG: T9SS type A sorting domain-containing protein, partial [Ignavibacteriales bacterium]|nr:T9SS type A sorting domain-containing protein [Ignavibacteriales bacterium]
FDNYYALSQKHRIIQHSGNKIYLVKNDDATNTFVKMDSLESADTLSVRDSIIILRNKNSVKVYGIDKNNFFFADSFTISNAVANYDYFGNLLVWYRNTSFEVHRRNGNTYSLLFSKTTLPKANKSFIKDSSLFIVDPNKGVGIYDLRSNYLGQEKWLKTLVAYGNSAAIFGDILWLKLGYNIFAYNISDLNISPVAIDSLTGAYDYSDFIVGNSGVYIRGQDSYYRSILTKVSLAGDSLINNYTCLLPVDTEPYQLTESHKTLIVAGIKNLYWIRDTSIVSGVDYTETGKAEEYSLEQNYPNPFNSETMISYRIPGEDKVTIKLYDVLGSEVAELIDDTKPAGPHQVRLNSKNLTSGVYFYQIVSGKYTNTKKLLILK